MHMQVKQTKTPRSGSRTNGDFGSLNILVKTEGKQKQLNLAMFEYFHGIRNSSVSAFNFKNSQ